MAKLPRQSGPPGEDKSSSAPRSTDGSGAQGPGTGPGAWAGTASWRDIWHLPVLLLGVVLFIVGAYLVVPRGGQPDYKAALDSVGEYLKANNLDGAQKQLKLIAPTISGAPDAQQGRYWAYWADLNYEQQKRQNPTGIATQVYAANNQKIVQYYTRADKLLDHQLPAVSLQREAMTLVALGHDKQALALVDRLQKTGASPRRQMLIVRDLIEHQSQTGQVDIQVMTPLIERFQSETASEQDPSIRRRQRIWITKVQAAMRLDTGDANGAIGFLLRHIPRLETVSPQPGQVKSDAADLAPLYVLLARAYQKTGLPRDARRYYLRAQKDLPPSADANAAILVGLAQITLADNQDEDRQQKALQLFAQVTRNYPSQQPAALDALIGQADVDARLGEYDTALDYLHRAVDKLTASHDRWPRRRTTLTRTVRSHITHANASKHYEWALRLLQTLKPLYPDTLPAKLLLDFATTHEHIAARYLAKASVGRTLVGRGLVGRASRPSGPPSGPSSAPPMTQPMTGETPVPLSASPPPTTQPTSFAATQPVLSPSARRLFNQQAAIHYGKAADYFLKYAHAVTITDDQAYGMAMWQAGVDFNKAQRWKDAIRVYSTYIKTRPDDPRRLMAINHLGKAFLADGQYDAAIGRFQTLIKAHPNSPQAFDSLVPMAQAYLAENKFDPARRTLLQVVTDHPSIRPDSDTYRQALIELGKLDYQQGEQDPQYYVKAIERLSEAVKRYSSSPQGPVLRFLLADSYRKSVVGLDQLLAATQAQDQQLTIKAQRSHRLDQARMYYNQVINEMDAADPKSLTPLEKLYYRNAYFYQADCAYQRGEYPLAIRLYSQANRKWASDPASLIALVQIVNAYCALGQYRKAAVINQQALWQLQRLPDSAFNRPGMPMTRRNWADWLRWSNKLGLYANQARATKTSGP